MSLGLVCPRSLPDGMATHVHFFYFGFGFGFPVGVWDINRPVEPIDSVALCEAFRAVGSPVREDLVYTTEDTTRVHLYRGIPQR